MALLSTKFSLSQNARVVASERAVASALDQAMQAEGGRHLKRIYKKQLQDLCATDARRWGDGILGYERITFANEEELAAKMLTLVRQWKTTGSQHPPLDPNEFPRIRRYAVVDCGVVGAEAKVAVAVYRSAWDTYWANWANLLGK